MKIKGPVLVFLLLLHCAQASDAAESAAADLLGALKEAATIASQKRLNIDEMPEFTTILRGEKLRAAGVKDLFDALALVPGIQTSVMQNGIKKVVMRGYDNPNSFVFDKFKLVVDDHTVTTVSFQNTSYYLNFPVELIERIEVVLGPAAALQTSGALTGVIKLYTRTGAGSGKGALFFRGGSWHEAMAGIRDTYLLAGGMRLAMDGYYRRHERMLDAREYACEETLLGIRRPESSEWNKDASFGAALDIGNLKITGRIKREHRGNYFGWEERLEASTDTGMAARYSYIQADWRTALNRTDTLHLQAAFNDFRYDASLQNCDSRHSLFLPVTLLQGERSWQAELSVTTRRFARQTLQAGLRGIATRQRGNRFAVGAPVDVDTALTREGLKRYLSSFYLVDSVDFTENFDAHFALRYDYLSDLHRGYLSADATLRYLLSDKAQLKAGYGHAYRAPSWIELHTRGYPGLRMGNPGLKAEEADTLEASLLLTPALAHRFTLNIYYTNVDNLIDNREIPEQLVGTEPEYSNYRDRESKGFEATYRYRPSVPHDITVSASYCDTDYVTEKGTAQSMPGVARWSGFLLYLFHFDASTTFSTRIRYMGPRTRYSDLADGDLGAYTTVDAAGSYVAPGGWRLHAAVKNLFDEEVRESSYYERHEGIVRPGRNFFVSVEFPL